MRIGTFIHYNDTALLESQFQTLVNTGFDCCQLGCWHPELFTEENAAIIEGLLKQYGITVSAFWCGWEGPKVWDFYGGQLTLGLVPAEYRFARMKNLCDGADFAKRLGITDMVTHMGYIPENPYDPNFPALCNAIKVVAKHLKQNGQFLLFETGQETPVTMLRCFEEVGCDNLGINLDTANLILYGKANPVDALDVFGKYVRNIHAKDGLYPTNGHDLGKETRIGDGKVDFKALFTKLRELGYDSYVTIEREISGEAQTRDILHAKEYLEAILREVYA